VQQPQHPTDAIVKTILPALKTFPSNEVAIIGCHTTTLSRPSCEYDLLIVNREPVPGKFIRVGDEYAEIMFKSEREIRQPDFNLALTLASANPLRDNSLLLASATSDCKQSFKSNCKKGTETRLASSLKALGRVDELISANQAREADFWLLSASLDFVYAELLANGVVPAPSHLLSQLKSIPKRRGSNFKQWADGFGLELSSRASCEDRLEAISVIYDVLRNTSMAGELATEMSGYREVEAIQVISMKAKDLIDSMQSVECFTFLGQEVVKSLLDLYTLHAEKLSIEKDYSSMIRDLTMGQDRLLSEEVMKSLGLVRSQEIIKASSADLKNSVSLLAKKI
jgi:hypothetical protein